MNHTYTKDGAEHCKACRANLAQERREHDTRWQEIRGRWLKGFNVAQRHREPTPFVHTCSGDAVIATSLAYRAMLEAVVNNSEPGASSQDETLVSVEMINECRGILGWEKK